MPDNKMPDYGIKPTQDMYEDWQKVYEHFKWRLFDDTLPNCLITLQRRPATYGYFSAELFRRKDGKHSHEIALNPRHDDPDKPLNILSTLVHEMVHLWQFHFGTPGRNRYHNREWADKMKSIGLQPTSTGKIGGRETGDSMTHVITPDGPFERAALELINSGFALTWRECVDNHSSSGEPSYSAHNLIDKIQNAHFTGHKNHKKSGRRVKYMCPQFADCRQSAYSKHDANLKCGVHDLPMLPSESKKRNAHQIQVRASAIFGS